MVNNYHWENGDMVISCFWDSGPYLFIVHNSLNWDLNYWAREHGNRDVEP